MLEHKGLSLQLSKFPTSLEISPKTSDLGQILNEMGPLKGVLKGVRPIKDGRYIQGAPHYGWALYPFLRPIIGWALDPFVCAPYYRMGTTSSIRLRGKKKVRLVGISIYQVKTCNLLRQCDASI